MTPEDFDALFDSFQCTVFRLEARPAYNVGGAEAERLRAFRDRSPRPERSVRTSPWLARIAATTAAGKIWTRVRVVDEPLTEYQRYQLVSYGESQAVGEQVRLVDRRRVGDVGPDFWLFDADTTHASAVLMRYDADGRFEGAEPVSDVGALVELDTARRTVEHLAVPLNEFLAAGGAGCG